MRSPVDRLWSSFGTAALVAGVLTFWFGMTHSQPVTVYGLWPFNGIWRAEEYCFLGILLSAVGAGSITSALLRQKTSPVVKTTSTLEGNKVSASEVNKVRLELQNLKKQLAETQNTTHQFNIAYDTMLTRLQERVNQVESHQTEAKIGTWAVESPIAREATQPLGRSSEQM